jgi:hypothetical protein
MRTMENYAWEGETSYPNFDPIYLMNWIARFDLVPAGPSIGRYKMLD